MDFLEVWNQQKPNWSEQTYSMFFSAAAIFFVVMMGIVLWRGYSKSRSLALFLLVVYLILVYASTVFSRENTISTVFLDGVSIPALTGNNYQLELFWSYRWGVDVCGPSLMRECFLNCIMLFPVGFLFPIIIQSGFRKKRYVIPVTMIVGLLISLSIEILQLVLQKGLCESDDVFHNVIGVLAGCLIWGAGYGLRWILMHFAGGENRTKEG